MSEDEQGLTKKQIEKLGKELEEHPIMNPKKLMVEDLKLYCLPYCRCKGYSQ
jgi:hypothetical protein